MNEQKQAEWFAVNAEMLEVSEPSDRDLEDQLQPVDPWTGWDASEAA